MPNWVFFQFNRTEPDPDGLPYSGKPRTEMEHFTAGCMETIAFVDGGDRGLGALYLRNYPDMGAMGVFKAVVPQFLTDPVNQKFLAFHQVVFRTI